jgi:DNA-binding transcriptional ArsR family regulator
MTWIGEAQDSRGLSPDDAFAILGNEMRIRILQALGDTDEPLSFTELRDRIGVRQGSQFNYHLDKLVGQFVVKSEEGYKLSHSGRRVVKAVLSGMVTESPRIDRTEIDWPCERCGASIEVTYEQERVERYCTECAGTYGQPTRPDQGAEYGYLGSMSLPPAGVEGRSPLEIQKAAAIWGHLEFLTAVSGVCPNCSARVEYSLDVCMNHDVTDGLCNRCDNRYAGWLDLHCTNCIYTLRSSVGGLLVVTAELLEFLAGHGLTPFSPSSRYPGVVWNPREEVLSTEPFEGRFTFEIDGGSCSVTVDDTLSVIDTAIHE